MIYNVTETCHKMPGIELIGGNVNHHRFLRWAIMVNRIDHEAYILHSKAGAFIQGTNDGGFNGYWTLIEFWSPDYQPFVDWLNANVEKEIAKMIEYGIWS